MTASIKQGHSTQESGVHMLAARGEGSVNAVHQQFYDDLIHLSILISTSSPKTFFSFDQMLVAPACPSFAASVRGIFPNSPAVVFGSSRTYFPVIHLEVTIVDYG